MSGQTEAAIQKSPPDQISQHVGGLQNEGLFSFFKQAEGSESLRHIFQLRHVPNQNQPQLI